MTLKELFNEGIIKPELPVMIKQVSESELGELENGEIIYLLFT